MSGDLEAWRQRRISSDFGTRHFALAPGCPDAMRYCDCKAFKAPWQVEQFITEQGVRDDSEE